MPKKTRYIYKFSFLTCKRVDREMAGRPPKTTLQQAARNGHKDVVKQHLSLPVSENNREKVLNAKDADGYTALHYAAKFNRFNILKLLWEAGANAMHKTTYEQLTALHLSARYLPHFQDPDAEAHEHVDSQEDTSASTSHDVTQYLIKECGVHVNVQDIYGVTPLHMACSRGNLAALEVLIEAPDIQLHISDNNQDTPLHEACLAGHPDVVETLLKKMNEKHIPLSLKNDENQTPLHFACKEGLDVVVKLILQYGDDRLVHTEDNELNSPLHLACESGKEAVVDTLLQNGVNVMAVKENDITPLHIAARLGFVEIAKMLVAKKKAIVRASDVSQQTPLHYAAQYNQCCMINFLLDQDVSLLHALDEDSRMPHLVAAAHGQADALKMLIKKGAPIDDLDKDGKSAVFVASEENHTEVLKVLLNNETGRKLRHTFDSMHNTPLHIASQMGNLEVVHMLVKKGVKIDSRNDISKTPIHLAAENGHVSVVDALIHYQSDTIQDEDEDSNSPLHLACINGHVEVAKVLIAAKCNIEARNSSLWTPMDCAASRGYEQLVSLLIKADADVDPHDKSKVTPLLLAAREGHLKVVDLLLNMKADVKSTDQNGNNALDLAIDNGHEVVAMAIINSSKWEEALRNTTEPRGVTTTPLRKLIRKMPKVAKEVLNKCTVTNAEKDGKIQPDSDDYLVIFNYEFLEDFQDKPSTSTDSLNKKCCSILIGNEGEETDDRSDSHSLCMSSEGEHADMITKLRTRKKRRFTTCWGPKGFKKAQHPLSIMVDSARLGLLKHPLVVNLLHYKWRSYGRSMYWGNLFNYIVFLVFLTTFALTVPHPESDTCKPILNDEFRKNLTYFNSTEQRNCHMKTARIGFVILAAIAVIISSAIRIFIELFQFVQLGVWNYLKDWVNWIELTLFTTSIIFAVVFFTDCLCPMGWQWQLGAMAVLLGWLDLILFLRKLLPLTGIYIVMFVDIFYTFCRLFVLALLLVIAFGLSFYMAFNEPHLKRTPFSTTARTLLNIMTMTTGEFDYSGIFRLAPMGTHETYEEIPFPPVSYILWIAFIIIMPILLTNLLVGLAVDNIKGTLDDAVLKRRALQVELVLTVEQVLPVYLRRYFITGSREIHPNRSLSLWEKCQYAWGREQKDSSENISKALNPPLTPIEQVQSQTRRLLREVDDMRQRNQRLENMLSAIVQHHNITVDDERKHFAQPSMVYRERISSTT